MGKSSGLWRGEEIPVSLSHPPPPQQFKEAVADLPDKPEDSDAYYLRWLRGAEAIIICTRLMQGIVEQTSQLTMYSSVWGSLRLVSIIAAGYNYIGCHSPLSQQGGSMSGRQWRCS